MLQLWSPTFALGAPRLGGMFAPESWRDEGRELVVDFDLAGYDPEEVRVEVKDGTLSVRAAHDERRSGFFHARSVAQTVSIPEGADERTLEAALLGGQLTVRVGKRGDLHRRTIPISLPGEKRDESGETD